MNAQRWTEGWRGALGAALLLALALVALHPDLALRGKVYASSDAQAEAAFKVVAERSRAAGEYPLWNPYVFAGMPSYGSLAYNPDVYPLSRPLRWARDLGAPPMGWLLVHLWIAGMGVVLWLRWRGVPLPAAMLAGLGVIMLPKLNAWAAYGHGTKVGTFAWMPWALWCADAWMARGRWPFAFGLALALALQLLRAHVQVAWYTVFAIALLAAFQLGPGLLDAARRRVALLRAAVLAGAGALALVASLVLYLPVLEYQGQSVRGSSGGDDGGQSAAQVEEEAWQYATNWSLSWAELPTLWWPTAAGYGKGSYAGDMPFTDYPHYVGLPVLLLAALSLLLRRDRWRWSLLALALVATLLALGRHGPLYRVFYELAPGFSKFRVPVMVLALQQVALLLLAADGLAALLAVARGAGRRPSWLRPLAWAVGAVALGCLLAGTVLSGTWKEWCISHWQGMRPGLPYGALAPAAEIAVGDAWRLGLVLAAGVGGFVLLARGRAGATAVGLAVALLVAWDLGAASQPLLHPDRHLVQLARTQRGITTVDAAPVVAELQTATEYAQDDELSAWLKSQSPRPRVWALGPLGSDNRLAARGIVNLGGYHAAKLRLYEELRSALYEGRPPAVRVAQLLGAEFVLAPDVLGAASLDALRELGLDLGAGPAWSGEAGVAYRIRNSFPRAWLVGSARPEADGAQPTDMPGPRVLAQLLAPGFDPASEAIVAGEPDPAPQPGAAAGHVELVEESDHRLLYRARAPAPGLLVAGEIYYPGWRATIDGEPAPLLRANYALRAVALPAGEHEVEFRFDGGSYQRGRWLSWAGMGVILLGLLLSLAAGRRGGSAPQRPAGEGAA